MASRGCRGRPQGGVVRGGARALPVPAPPAEGSSREGSARIADPPGGAGLVTNPRPSTRDVPRPSRAPAVFPGAETRPLTTPFPRSRPPPDVAGVRERIPFRGAPGAMQHAARLRQVHQQEHPRRAHQQLHKAPGTTRAHADNRTRPTALLAPRSNPLFPRPLVVSASRFRFNARMDRRGRGCREGTEN